MNGASKILTVSYGTFSCTLEGFDDPFNTMRAIAEYFRDLAAEDRYFGAEPPTPDAAMLHRIAEREINRRVEANIQENGVILRAGDVEVSKPQPPRSVPAVAPAALAPIEPMPGADRPSEDDSIATRLIRLREAQAAAERAAAETPVSGIEDEAEAEVAAQSPMLQADVWEMTSAAETVVPAPAPTPAQLEAAKAEVEADSPMLQADVWDSRFADDTIASVMAELDEPLPDQAQTATEPVILTQPLDEPLAVVETEADEVAGGTLADDTASAAVEAPESVREETALADATLIELPEEEASAIAEAGVGPAVQPSDDAILQAALGAMIDPDGDAEFDAPQGAEPARDVAGEVTDLAALANEAVVEPVDIAISEPQAVVEELPAAEVTAPAAVEDAAAPQTDTRAAERLQRARARVIKIRRIDVGPAAAPASAESAPAEVTEPVAETPANEPASALSPEAEAELQRELANLEADLSRGVTPEQPAAPHAEPHRPADPTSADDAVNRLISQTNAAMEGPENKRRLAAIAHLKAAVAATFADRKTNAAPVQPAPTERMDPYREDLDRVVRPRRPALVAPDAQEANAAPARPQMESRPAPLVLVSEQRIDRPAAAAPRVTPVRPRRVTSDVLPPDTRRTEHDAATETDIDEDGYLTADDVNNIFADPSQPFSEFAERLGAVTMPDLMEAAAAYCELQLGRDQFTRPLLLQQIARLPTGEAFNREDCLRGFGTLLRDGRIQKIKRGQFRLSGQSRYLAEAKRTAG